MSSPSSAQPDPDAGAPYVGVNLPWLVYGCDFGRNRWFPEGGVGRPDAQARLRPLFGRLAGAHLCPVRWFLFCDGRAGLVVDGDERPTGLDPCCFRDVDAALALADEHGLRLLFVLFDFPWFRPRRWVNGVGLFGRRRMVARGDQRAALLDRVVVPLLARYGREPLIRAWDIVNEPEWATWGYGAFAPWRGVGPATMRAWMRELAAAVHSETVQPVTVGLASARGLPLVGGCGLDFFQVHWYDRRERRSPLARAPILDRPVLLGEFPTSSFRRSPAEVLAAARAAGYSGALAWSATASDRYSSLSALEDALRR